MLLVVEDLADDKRTMGCGLIREPMLKGRHSMTSTMLNHQKMRAIDHTCRLQLTTLHQYTRLNRRKSTGKMQKNTMSVLVNRWLWRLRC